ncbi:CHAT domain-containing protein [Nostoc sp. CMAA1605]|uniref:CHAT domain-containing protein n=1 Tax=Nostoc sp. CMAA1605 TaxID=2055159 RepID=UPI001F1EE87C|nr:CHAT domain-containing protein [Nostoc sp. CMAA1605]MCF4967773.1 CHAT domain-containing protein [Nostoc sp. CMAA1605]
MSKKYININYIKSTSCILITNICLFTKVAAQSTDLPTQTLQRQLILQNNYPAALEISERSRNRSLINLLSKQAINPISTQQIKQVAKQQNATLVQYTIINDAVTIAGKKQTQASEIYIWLIKPTGEVAFRSIELKPFFQQENTSLSQLINSSRQSLGVTSDYTKGIIKVTPTHTINSQRKLQKLHQLLIAPIAELLPEKADAHIIFIPQGELFLVPFAALQDSKGQYLIDKHTIATAPSIQAIDLLYQRQTLRKTLPENVLIVGNPTMPDVALDAMPGAEQEAKNIADIFNTQALIGDAATETAVVAKMSQAKIIHLATQNGCSDSSKSLCGLTFASSSQDNGWLTSEEILNLNLQADLVVLSAGDTALGKITADGVIGLSRSFFAAGVSSVIGSLWTVSDRETAFLMTAFYQQLSKNPDKAAALRHAMLETKKKYPNPSHWASFTLIGLL